MATEQHDREQLSIDLPPDLDAWLREQAAERGTDRNQLLQRLLEATRLALVTDDGIEDIDDLESRVTALESDLDEKVDDVRERVIQVKKETDAKAPADHSHEELDRVEALDERIAGLVSTISKLQSEVETLQGDVAEHDESVEAVNERLKKVARAVVAVQRAADEFGGDDRLAELKSAAGRRGFAAANCGACGNSVKLGLLTEANCPHCDTAFGDLEGKSGLFSTPTLVAEGHR